MYWDQALFQPIQTLPQNHLSRPQIRRKTTDGSAAPWTKKRDEIVELRTSTEQSRSGDRSIEVVLPGEGSKGFLQSKGLSDISAGDVLTFYVCTPSPAPALEKLVAGAVLTMT